MDHQIVCHTAQTMIQTRREVKKTHLVDAIGIEFREYSQRSMTGLF